jgi:hypothetical protein
MEDCRKGSGDLDFEDLDAAPVRFLKVFPLLGLTGASCEVESGTFFVPYGLADPHLGVGMSQA